MVLDPDYSSSVLNTVLHTINNKFRHKCLDMVVKLLKAHLIRRLNAD